ncbi:phosphate regulon sensor histidine kinase PhoR [Oleiagrimonas sp. C23AA]|uniref:phosphate regulon sensor histidine kinase PhoR n=1 Tax=Oleiagrimonas sp. C23AA TaxID=2719047 RepID=UPI0014235B48|nr:phosphate regulon sensor histidine kinase PhoR [Oleiagrimonas sp. C23AA]NII11803.1 phosphate regulon sensor histidine kinase PhoR [Oleiagrimonas sp. C23AA]
MDSLFRVPRYLYPALLAAFLAACLLDVWLGRGPWIVAVVACAQIVLLVSLFRHQQRTMIEAVNHATRQQHERYMTRSRRLANQLRDLRSAAGSLPDAVVLLDRDGRVHWFNHASEHLLGLRRRKDRGVVLSERLSGSELGQWLADGAREPLNELAAPGDPTRQLNVMMIPFGGQQRLLQARDISNLARLEKVRRDFVANVSHELRTPLTVIHGYLELLDPEDIPELSDVLKEMRAQSKRMGQIVEDLLTLSRLETQQQLPDEHVSMDALMATLRKEAEALSQGRHTVVMENDAHVDLRGSSKELHSALSNLVSNAVRYTPTGGTITIRWQRSDEGATYSVTDTGYGIPASHLARLTERFYRVSSSRSRETGGTGLGLSIVKHVLNLHQAHMTVQSEPGKGSTFACVFDAERLLEPGSRPLGDDDEDGLD